MKISFSKTLRAPMDWLVQFAAAQCCRRKVPRLTVTRSLPLEKRMRLLTDWLDTLHSREAFNGTVLIAKSGKICFERHYGFADVDGVIPLSNHSSFSLASVSKQFTAMGIMLLVQKGKLKLHDKIAQHIAELVDYGEIGRSVRVQQHRVCLVGRDHIAGVRDALRGVHGRGDFQAT